MLDLNKKRTIKELKSLLDSIKVSDLPVDEKSKLIDEIEFKISGRRFTDDEVMKDIIDGQSDISDIN